MTTADLAEELALVVADLCESRGVSVRDLVDALERPRTLLVTQVSGAEPSSEEVISLFVTGLVRIAPVDLRRGTLLVVGGGGAL